MKKQVWNIIILFALVSSANKSFAQSDELYEVNIPVPSYQNFSQAQIDREVQKKFPAGSDVYVNLMGTKKNENISSYPREIPFREQMSLGRDARGQARSYAGRCNRFYDPRTGQIGAFGAYLLKSLNASRFAGYLKSYPMGRLCPKYLKLNDTQKDLTYLAMFGGLANEESGCNENENHAMKSKKGLKINPSVDYGMFSAEKDPGLRRRNRAGLRCGNISSAQGQIDCAVDTLGSALPYHKAAFNCKSYWGPIRRSFSDDPCNARVGRANSKGQRASFNMNQINPYVKRLGWCN